MRGDTHYKPQPFAPIKVDRVPHEALVPRVGQVYDPQGHLHGGGLAGRRAEVRLERVPEPAVRVAVGRDRVPHRRGRAPAEQPLEHPPVEHPRAGGEEVRRRVEVRSLVHALHLTSTRAAPS